MTNWTKIGDLLSATINGHDYAITKLGSKYMVWCDGDDIGDPPYCTLENAKAAAEAHAESLSKKEPTVKPKLEDALIDLIVEAAKLLPYLAGKPWLQKLREEGATEAEMRQYVDDAKLVIRDKPGAPEGGPLG